MLTESFYFSPGTIQAIGTSVMKEKAATWENTGEAMSSGWGTQDRLKRIWGCIGSCG